MSSFIFKKYCTLLSEDFCTFTKSVDRDEIQHNAAIHLGLHCLQKYSFRGFQNTKGEYILLMDDWLATLL